MPMKHVHFEVDKESLGTKAIDKSIRVVNEIDTRIQIILRETSLLLCFGVLVNVTEAHS